MKIKVYSIVSVFQGEGYITEQGTDREKIRAKFKEQIEDGCYYDLNNLGHTNNDFEDLFLLPKT